MRKSEFLSTSTVMGFINWVETILDTPQAFCHTYYHKKERTNYEFDNLYTAHSNYSWTLNEDIEDFSKILIKSLDESDEETCKLICLKILKWGGVYRGNSNHINNLSPTLCLYLKGVKFRLLADLSSLEYSLPSIHMSSGFSKIYSAYIEDFIIYDSRVAAAIGLFVVNYCKIAGIISIPNELQFAWLPGVGSQLRNPSCNEYYFPLLRRYKQGEYLENNIRANWLITTIAKQTKSKFKSIDKHLRARALEQALFMIGYDLSYTIKGTQI